MNEQLNYPAYVPQAILVRESLQESMREASNLLPRFITDRHVIADFTSPDAWEAVEFWYRNQPGALPRMMTVLTDLKLMGRAFACLKTVTTHRDERPMGSLKLATKKRVELPR